jgi:hypothetical protein
VITGSSAIGRNGAEAISNTSAARVGAEGWLGRAGLRGDHIRDHGNETGCFIGKDWIDTKTFGTFAPLFIPILALLAKDGWLHLQHCDVGQNEPLLRMFALAFGAPVYAATGSHVGSPINIQFGMIVRCSPGGTIYRNAFLPGESDYTFTK